MHVGGCWQPKEERLYELLRVCRQKNKLSAVCQWMSKTMNVADDRGTSQRDIVSVCEKILHILILYTLEIIQKRAHWVHSAWSPELPPAPTSAMYACTHIKSANHNSQKNLNNFGHFKELEKCKVIMTDFYICFLYFRCSFQRRNLLVSPWWDTLICASTYGPYISL